MDKDSKSQQILPGTSSVTFIVSYFSESLILYLWNQFDITHFTWDYSKE